MHHNHQTIVNLFASLPPLCLPFAPDSTVAALKLRLHEVTSVPFDAQRISTLGGRYVTDDALLFDPAQPDGPVTFCLSLRVFGGKGGFGTILRAQGGRMASQKTTNYEACRDLSGRRLKTVNEAKKLADLLEKQPEIEKARKERLQRKIERGLKEPPQKKYRFNDQQFLEDREEVIEGVKTAAAEAMRKGIGAARGGKGKKRVEERMEEEEGEEEESVGLVGYWDENMSDYESGDEEGEEGEERKEENEEDAESNGSGDNAKLLVSGEEVESGYSSNGGATEKVDKGKEKETRKRKERA